MVKKILCATDDSEHSKSAVAFAAELAKAMGAEVTILAVNTPVGGAGRGGIVVYAWEDADLKRCWTRLRLTQSKLEYRTSRQRA